MPQSSPETASNSSPAGVLIGSIIGGKYRVDGVLGAGGMGVVLAATNLALDAQVAIKVVRAEFADHEEVVARMLQEARSVAKMHGIHVVRVLDVASLETGTPYIVMEMLRGQDLATLLDQRGALPIEEAVGYVLQACEGLAEAHALGIVHRDLKPENLFLAVTPDGPVLKVLDFGVSKDRGGGRGVPRPSLSKTGCAVGSPYYMSPEQMRASPHVDERADIWSLGAVLFELLTGKGPFEGESVHAICSNVLTAAPRPLRAFWPEAPEALDAIILRCLEKDAAARYESVNALAVALRAFVATQGQGPPNRSLRLASGISLVPKALPARSKPSPEVVSSSPTIPSHLIAGTGRRRAVRVAAVALALAVGAVATAFWQRPTAFGAASVALAPTVNTARAAPVVSAPVPAATPSAPRLDTMVVAPAGQSDLLSAPQADLAQRVSPRARAAAGATMPFAKRDAPPARPKWATSAASASVTALDDLKSSHTSGQQAPVNAWDPNSLGGRN